MARWEKFEKGRQRAVENTIQAYCDISTIIYESPLGQAEAKKGGEPGDVVRRVLQIFGERQRMPQQAAHGL